MLTLTQQWYQRIGLFFTPFDGLPALAIRLYLVPVFWMAGTSKLNNFESTVAWFGNVDWGLGLPLPWLLAALASAAEAGGAVLLLLGLGTRLISIPLMATMAVAAATVHWPNGWQAIADASAPFGNAAVLEAPEKLERARALLQEYGNYDWLTSSGNFVILNNGMEFSITYLVLCLALLKLGGGRYVSLDHWLTQRPPVRALHAARA